MKEKILVTVKTYPNLSRKYRETVCVAGINEKGEWRRLFPIPFRQLPFTKKFKRYDWIEVETTKAKEKLMRKESYHVDPDTIKIIGHIDTKNKWSERNKIILPLTIKSIEEFNKLIKQDKTSLAIIKPKEMLDEMERLLITR